MDNDCWRATHAWLTGYSDALEQNAPDNRKYWDGTSTLLAAYERGYEAGASLRVAVSA